MMEGLFKLVERVDSRLMMVAIVIFSALIFSVFKVATSFSSKKPDYTYANTPAQAFVPPASSVLVEPSYLSQPRLPDPDFIAVVTATKALASPVANLTVTQAQLEAQGMSASLAQSTVLTLQGNDSSLQGRSFSVDGDYTVTPGSAGDTAEVSTVAQYSTGQSGSPPVTASLSFSFNRASDTYPSAGYDKWVLQSTVLTVDQQATAAAPAAGSTGATSQGSEGATSTGQGSGGSSGAAAERTQQTEGSSQNGG